MIDTHTIILRGMQNGVPYERVIEDVKMISINETRGTFTYYDSIRVSKVVSLTIVGTYTLPEPAPVKYVPPAAQYGSEIKDTLDD